MKKKSAASKRAMTEKRERWQNKEWHGKTKSHWQQQVDRGRMVSGEVQSLNASGKRSLLRLTQWGPL